MKLDIPWRYVIFLSLWSFACVVPVLIANGPNVCGVTFAEGADRFWSGLNPYAAPLKGDLFQYSPFFAFAYRIFSSQGPLVHSMSWVFLNSFLFWVGVGSWQAIGQRLTPWGWAALILCAMELDISLRYQQTNPMVIGLILLGIAAYRKERWAVSGAILALVVNIKIFPVILAGLLFIRPFRKSWALSFLLTSMGLCLLPCVVVGLRNGVWLHWEQYRSIRADLPSRHLLDLYSLLQRWDFPVVASLSRAFIAGALLILFPWKWFTKGSANFAWEEWLFFMMTSMLLLIPRVESPTFVWMAPAYLLLMNRSGKKTMSVIVLAGLLATFIYTSAWPKAFQLPIQEFWASKTIGALLLWMVCLKGLVAPSALSRRRVHREVSIS